MAKRSTVDPAEFHDAPAARARQRDGKSRMERALDTIERVGNKVPHPVVIFVMLIGLVIVLSHVFYLFGASATYQAVNPETHEIESITTYAQSLLTADGLRFMPCITRNASAWSATGCERSARPSAAACSTRELPSPIRSTIPVARWTPSSPPPGTISSYLTDDEPQFRTRTAAVTAGPAVRPGWRSPARR